jgi:hypothetical protein
VVVPASSRAAVFMSQGQALEAAFPGARVERLPFVLTDAEVEAVQARARVRLASRLVTAHCAWHGDTLAGVAFFDTRTVRTMPGVFMVVVAPDSTVARVEVLAFHEPPDYRPPPRWLPLFGRRRLDDRLWPQRDIRNLSGSTLSARAVTESVRQSLALWEVLVAPRLAGAAPLGEPARREAPRR